MPLIDIMSSIDIFKGFFLNFQIFLYSSINLGITTAIDHHSISINKDNNNSNNFNKLNKRSNFIIWCNNNINKWWAALKWVSIWEKKKDLEIYPIIRSVLVKSDKKSLGIWGNWWIQLLYLLCFENDSNCKLYSVIVVHNDVQQQQQQQQQRSNGDGTLSPTSNQLARWFSPELLAQGNI